MKLEKVESPFDKEWKSAYIVTNKENRKMVCLYKDVNTRKTISYARYLLSVKLGRELTDKETADHIDENKTNDSIENLQILSIEENRNKHIELMPHNIHGTNQMYRNGCRCELCKKWHSDYTKNYFKLHPDKYENFVQKREKNIEKVCEYCKQIFYVDSSHKDNRFCSKRCATSFRYHK